MAESSEHHETVAENPPVATSSGATEEAALTNVPLNDSPASAPVHVAVAAPPLAVAAPELIVIAAPSPVAVSPAPVVVTATGDNPSSKRGSRASSVRAASENLSPTDDKKHLFPDFKVAEAEPNTKVAVPCAAHVDMCNRDPDMINQHLKVRVYSVIG